MSAEIENASEARELGFSLRHGVNWTEYTLYRPTYAESFFRRIYEYHTQKPEACWSTAHDVGAGHGRISLPLSKSFERVIVSDPNGGYTEVARRVLEEECGEAEVDSKFVFLQETAESSSLDAETVDLITAGSCMHWTDTVQAVDEFARQLKPGGTLVMALNMQPLIIGNERAQSIWEKIFLALSKKATGPLFEHAAQIINNAYDSIAIPSKHWEGIKRVYINASRGIESFRFGDHTREDRVGSHEERIWVDSDSSWFHEQGVAWMKKYVDTWALPLPESEIQGLWDELEDAANGAKFRMKIPMVMVLATKRKN
ncbi:hypothetical protein ANO14919_131770 [Xylariales sp. No.14919]|nr:hypothetical protein ANO14919_131770 [Xylariales sp. No.14919]